MDVVEVVNIIIFVVSCEGGGCGIDGDDDRGVGVHRGGVHDDDIRVDDGSLLWIFHVSWILCCTLAILLCIYNDEVFYVFNFVFSSQDKSQLQILNEQNDEWQMKWNK